MQTFLILGRNPLLSHAEVLSYLKSREIKYKQIFFDRNYLVVDLPENFQIDIQELGGTIKIGKINFSGNAKQFHEFLETEELIPKEKFSYSISGNYQEAEDFLKRKFKFERKKAVIKHSRKTIKLQDGEPAELAKSNFELFIHEFENKIYFGTVGKSYSYKNIKQRDMKKPI